MANIENELETIRTAVYGKDMRKAIADALAILADTSTIAAFIRYSCTLMFPENTVRIYTERVTDESGLYGAEPSYVFDAEDFAPSIDGFFVWRNKTELIPPSYCLFDTETTPGKVIVTFNVADYFKIGDTVVFYIYKKPERVSSRGALIGRTVQNTYGLTGGVQGYTEGGMM